MVELLWPAAITVAEDPLAEIVAVLLLMLHEYDPPAGVPLAVQVSDVSYASGPVPATNTPAGQLRSTVGVPPPELRLAPMLR